MTMAYLVANLYSNLQDPDKKYEKKQCTKKQPFLLISDYHDYQGLSRLVILSDVTGISYNFRVLPLIPAIEISVRPVVTITPFSIFVTKAISELEKGS